MLIAVSSFGKGLRWIFLTEPAEAVLCLQEYKKGEVNSEKQVSDGLCPSVLNPLGRQPVFSDG